MKIKRFPRRNGLAAICERLVEIHRKKAPELKNTIVPLKLKIRHARL